MLSTIFTEKKNFAGNQERKAKESYEYIWKNKSIENAMDNLSSILVYNEEKQLHCNSLHYIFELIASQLPWICNFLWVINKTTVIGCF